MLDFAADRYAGLLPFSAMDLISRIHRQFEDHLHAQQEALELLAAPLAGAAEAMVSCLLDNGRILVCGDGSAELDARRFVGQLLHGFEHPRPSLAALLVEDGLDCSDDEAQARTILALGHPGDILLGLAPQSSSPAFIAALAAARERDLRCIVLASSDDELLSELPGTDDILLPLPSLNRPGSTALQHLLLNCLGDGIDCLLLGVEH